MSPHPIEMHTSPARASFARRTDEVFAPRQPDDPLLRVGVGDGVHDELAGDAWNRRGPRRVDVGEHDDVGVDERVRVLVGDLGHAVVPVGLEHARSRVASRRRCRGRRPTPPRSRSGGGRSRRRRSLRRRSRVCRIAVPRRRTSPTPVRRAHGSTPTASAIAAAPVAFATLWTPRRGSSIVEHPLAVAHDAEREGTGGRRDVDGPYVDAARDSP